METSTADPSTGSPLYCSKFEGFGLRLNGSLDDARFYSRALNSAELKALLDE